MGRRGKGWFRAFKKVFRPDSKHKKGQKSNKSNPERLEQPELFSSEILQSSALDAAPPPSLPLAPASKSDEGKFAEADLEQSKQVCSVTIPSSTEDPTNFNSSINVTVKSSEEGAAIKIQTAFRGYLARRALRALRGLVRLKSLVHGNAVKRQATTTLRCMQTLARIQSQIRSRRMRMTEENQALQRQLLLKRERELENLRMSEEWDDSLQSKEQIEAGLLSKQEASIRRERALAYAFSHQWKNSTKSTNPTFMDPSNPHWGWSWLERWMAARPWDSRSAIAASDKELSTDRPSSKGANAASEIGKSGRPDSNLNGTAAATPQKAARPPSRQSPGTPPRSKPSKVRSTLPPDDDARSMMSTQSERPRRHSLAAYSSLRDDDGSLTSSPAIPSYMAPTSSARAKSRTQSPMSDGMAGSPERAGSLAPVMKKRLSFPSSPAAARRHSGPPRVDVSMTQVAAAPQEPDLDVSNAAESVPLAATATTVLVG